VETARKTVPSLQHGRRFSVADPKSGPEHSAPGAGIGMIPNIICAANGTTRSKAGFKSSSAYEIPGKRKLVNCPVCGSAKVEPRHHGPADREQRKGPARSGSSTCRRPPRSPRQHRRRLMMAQERELRTKLKELRDHIVKNATMSASAFRTKPAKCITAISSIARSTRGLAGGSPLP